MKIVYFSKRVEKFLEKLQKSDKNLAKKIRSEIELLKVSPLHPSTKKLAKLKNLYRSRVEKYRIVYEFNDKSLYILLIEKRDKVYEILKRETLH